CSPQAPALKGKVPMVAMLLTCSLLTFWSLPTTAQLTIGSVPPNAAKGKDVLLCVHNLPWFLGGYVLFKGESADSNHQIVSYVIDAHEIQPGPAYSSQETIYPNGSLLFQVTLKDTGYYTIVGLLYDSKTEIFQPYRHSPQREGTPGSRNPEEPGQISLITTKHKWSTSTRMWFFNDHNLLHTERMEQSQGISTLTIDLVWSKDTGGYQCEVFNPVGSDKGETLRLDIKY
uniref:Uncharacterized protein n=1 Tax=Myotis lucifugus TaxID=59463 RepID=G1Q0P7_MYOLU